MVPPTPNPTPTSPLPVASPVAPSPTQIPTPEATPTVEAMATASTIPAATAVPPLPVAIPAPIPTPTPRPLFTITNDDFETATRLGGDERYWQGGWMLEGDAHIRAGLLYKGQPPSGRVHLILQGAGSRAQRTVDLSRESSVRLQFWAKADSFESTDDAEALICSGGCADDADWTTLRRWVDGEEWVDGEDDNTYRFYDFPVPGSMLTEEFQVGFWSGMSGDTDWFFVDDVTLVFPVPGPTPTLTPTATPRPTPSPRPTKKPKPVDVAVTLTDQFRFQPSSITVKAGASVTFIVSNTDQFRNHTFTVVPTESQKSPKLVDTGEVNTGGSATRTKRFTRGQYYYYCTVPGHELAGMKGTLTVRQ